MPRHSPISNPQSPTRPTRAFTLIEILVVVAIIGVLVGILIPVGLSVRTNAAIRSTHNTLKTLEGVMADYLKEGNPEPTTTIVSPPDTTIWVTALRANPNYAKKISSLTTSTSGTNITLTDAFGSAIAYVPYNLTTKKEGYFQSPGPDRTFTTVAAPSTDDLYSTDP